MAALTRSEAIISLIDHNGKIRQVSFGGTALSAVTYVDVANDANSLMNAIEAITLGNTVSRALVGNRDYNTAPTVPADPDAQASRRWLLRAQDTVTGRFYTFTVPTADMDSANPTWYVVSGTPPTTHLNLALAGSPGLALKTAFDNYAPLSPEGNQMTLQEAYYINS